MRRLWTASQQLTKKDMTDLTMAETTESKKVSIAVIQDKFSQAEARGLVLPNDRVTPSDYTMGKVIANFQPGGEHRYIEWEEYISKSDEEQARLQHIKPKAGFTFIKTTGNILEGREENTELRRLEEVGIAGQGLLVFEDMMAIRSVAFDIAMVCNKSILDDYTTIFMNALRDTPPPAYRVPTIDEVRLFDKLISEDIFKLVSKGRGTVAEGLTHFLGDGRSNRVWKMLEQVPESFPDRGARRAIQQVAAFDTNTGLFVQTQDQGAAAKSPTVSTASSSVKKDAQGKTLCTWCDKPRDNHPGRNFLKCPKNPNLQKPSPATGSSPSNAPGGQKRKKGDSKGDKGKRRTGVPEHLAGPTVAKREPPSQEHPEGKRFCFDFHTDGKTCTRSPCTNSHLCPKFLADGKICLAGHPIFRHGG